MTCNWNSIKNTWSIEAKILHERLEIQANFKVRFLRQNDKMTWIDNFRAFGNLSFWTKNVLWTQCGPFKGKGVKLHRAFIPQGLR